MKFANNSPDSFVTYGSYVAYLLGFITMITAVVAETVNIYLLSNQHLISHCIIHFVALEVITEVSKIYFEGQEGTNKLVVLMHHHPEVHSCSRDIGFGDRNCINKILRIIYRSFRSVYVSLFFYFFPFAILFLQFVAAPEKEGEGGE